MDKPLDVEQLEKRVEWLDSERRNDKTLIASLQNKLEAVETENNTLRLRLTDLESEITRINTLMARIENFEQDINTLGTETGRQITTFKESLQEHQMRTERHQKQIEDLNTDLIGIRKQVQGFEGIQEKLDERRDEDIRLSGQIEETKTQLSEVQRFDEEYKRSIKMIEESRRQDTKRLTDIQGEIASIRKRQEETRAKQELVGDNMRKLENRIKGLLDAESERRESQTAFIEKVNLAQVERDRKFQQWEERFDKMEVITATLEEEISGLEDTHRSVKQSQSVLDEVTQRFERRINEITEVQRLNEDRFRQEWTTFKSDDQKRWSNYIISQEEQHREMNRSLDGLGDRLITLEEIIATLEENFQQTGKHNIKRMQSQLAIIRDALDTYNNIFKD
jgi:chromosome segregation ATPase